MPSRAKPNQEPGLESTSGGWKIMGNMDYPSVPNLIRQAKNELDFSRPLSIDMTLVEHGDSAGLALLLDWLDESRAKGGSLTLIQIPKSLMNIAEVSNASDMLKSTAASKIST